MGTFLFIGNRFVYFTFVTFTLIYPVLRPLKEFILL